MSQLFLITGALGKFGIRIYISYTVRLNYLDTVLFFYTQLSSALYCYKLRQWWKQTFYILYFFLWNYSSPWRPNNSSHSN